MIFSSEHGDRGVLVDLDTNERIPMACWCNTETGEWKRQIPGPDGKALRKEDGTAFLVLGKGRIKFVPSPKEQRKSLVSYEESVGNYIEVFNNIWRDRGFSPNDVRRRLDAKKRRERCLGGW